MVDILFSCTWFEPKAREYEETRLDVTQETTDSRLVRPRADG